MAKLNVAVRNVKSIPGRRRTAHEAALLASHVICGDAISILSQQPPKFLLPQDTVIYCDPPYLLSTRTSRHRYQHEMTDENHEQLLASLQGFNCCVLISGYPSKLYSARLKGWRCMAYRQRTRGRTLTECLWSNQAEPSMLHDWSFFGRNYRERVTIKRLASRFLGKLERMAPAKRNFLLSLVHQRLS